MALRSRTPPSSMRADAGAEPALDAGDARGTSAADAGAAEAEAAAAAAEEEDDEDGSGCSGGKGRRRRARGRRERRVEHSRRRHTTTQGSKTRAPPSDGSTHGVCYSAAPHGDHVAVVVVAGV